MLPSRDGCRMGHLSRETQLPRISLPPSPQSTSMASLVLDVLAPRDDRTRCCLYRCVNGARAALALVSYRGTKRNLLSNWLLPGRRSYGCYSCHLGGMLQKMFVLIDRCNGQSAWQSVIPFFPAASVVSYSPWSVNIDMCAPAPVLLDIFHMSFCQGRLPTHQRGRGRGAGRGRRGGRGRSQRPGDD